MPERTNVRVVYGPEPKVDRFFDLVEKAWWDEMQGELQLDEDSALASLALGMESEARRIVEMTSDAVEQFDGKDQVIPQNEPSDEEYARRVARSLRILFYGGV